MVDVTVGHTVDCTIVYLDQNGNPMLTTVTPDSPPSWTDIASSPAIDALSVSADGSQCEITTTGAGSDTVSLSVIVGGKTFNASLQLNIASPPQVLTRVSIQTVVS